MGCEGVEPSTNAFLDKLCPEVPVGHAILNCFAELFGGDVVGLGEVGDGPRNFEDAVIGAGASARARHLAAGRTNWLSRHGGRTRVAPVSYFSPSLNRAPGCDFFEGVVMELADSIYQV